MIESMTTSIRGKAMSMSTYVSAMIPRVSRNAWTERARFWNKWSVIPWKNFFMSPPVLMTPAKPRRRSW